MAGGRTPVNQLNALPLITAAKWVSGEQPTGQVKLQSVTKYWSPAGVGISLATPLALGTTPGAFACFGNLIDLTGCTAFTLVQTKRIRGAASETATGGTLYFQGTPAGIAFPVNTDAFYNLGLGLFGFPLADFTSSAGYAYQGSGYPYNRVITRGYSSRFPRGDTPVIAGSEGPIVGGVGRFILVVPDPNPSSLVVNRYQGGWGVSGANVATALVSNDGDTTVIQSGDHTNPGIGLEFEIAIPPDPGVYTGWSLNFIVRKTGSVCPNAQINIYLNRIYVGGGGAGTFSGGLLLNAVADWINDGVIGTSYALKTFSLSPAEAAAIAGATRLTVQFVQGAGGSGTNVVNITQAYMTSPADSATEPQWSVECWGQGP